MAKIVGNLWLDYKVEFNFTTAIFGSFPGAESVLRSFVEQKIEKGKLKLKDGEGIKKKISEARKTLPSGKEMEDQRTLVFRRIPREWFGNNSYLLKEKKANSFLGVHGGSIRSHIKDCARALSQNFMPTAKGTGEKSLGVRATHGLYVQDNWVPIVKNGKPLSTFEFYEEFSIHTTDFRTGQPIDSLKRCEGVRNPVSLSFILKTLGSANGESSLISREELAVIFEYGGIHGYGQERSRGYGRYVYEITPLFTLGEKKKAAADKALTDGEFSSPVEEESFVPLGLR